MFVETCQHRIRVLGVPLHAKLSGMFTGHLARLHVSKTTTRAADYMSIAFRLLRAAEIVAPDRIPNSYEYFLHSEQTCGCC